MSRNKNIENKKVQDQNERRMLGCRSEDEGDSESEGEDDSEGESGSESEDGLSLKLVDESENQTKLDYYIFNTGTKNRIHNNTTLRVSF